MIDSKTPIWEMTDAELDEMLDREMKMVHALDYYLERVIPLVRGNKVRVTGFDATKTGRVVVYYEDVP